MHIEVKITPTLPTDSANYEVLYEGVLMAKGVPGATVEIGVREGGGSKYIMDALVASEQHTEKVHIGIDPYGNIEYDRDNWFGVGRCDYTNEMRDRAMINLYMYAQQNKINFYMFNMEDTEFFARFADGVPVYNQNKFINNQYSFVHFDGPHTIEWLNLEVPFFHDRSPVGAVFAFDDVQMYEHELLDERLLEIGYERVMETERKWLYKKIEEGKAWSDVVIPQDYEKKVLPLQQAQAPGVFSYKVG